MKSADNVIGQIYETDDYNKFKTFIENRTIDMRKVKKISESMKKQCYLSPIIVDGEYNIIDGQHRFEALKELGLKVPYIFGSASSDNRAHVIELNKNQTAWKIEDYVRSYAGTIDSYRWLLKLMYCHNVNAYTALAATGNRKSPECIKDGTFSMTKEEYEDGDEVIKRAIEILDILNSKMNNFELYASIRMVRSPFVKIKILRRQCDKYKLKYSHASSQREALQQMINIYNYNRSNGKVRLKGHGRNEKIVED